MPEVPGVIEHPPKVFIPKEIKPISEKITHRCDINYVKKINNFKKKQLQLQEKINDLQNSSHIDIKSITIEILILKKQCEAEIFYLSLIDKIHSEFIHVRKRLSLAIKNGYQTESIRQRLNWLENRLEDLFKKLENYKSTESDSESKNLLTETENNDFENQDISDHFDGNAKENHIKISINEALHLQRNESERSHSEIQSPISSVVSSREFHNSDQSTKCLKFGQIEMPEHSDISNGNQHEFQHERSSLAADAYWNSEHHRMTYASNIPVLLNLNHASLHALSIAEAGIYTEPLDADNKPMLAWRPHRRESEFEEIHKDALDKLIIRVHAMHADMHESALASVNLNREEFSNNGLISKKTSEAAHVKSENKGSTFPKLAGKSKIFVPLPLLEPAILPTVKLDTTQLLPPTGVLYSDSQSGENKPADRIVHQGNLFKETKISSHTYKQKTTGTINERSKSAASSLDERRLKGWVRQDMHANSASTTTENSKPSSQKRRQRLRIVNDLSELENENKDTQLITSSDYKSILPKANAVLASWKQIKPKSGALQHSGLKWERIKEIVQINLNSERTLERQDAARNLGQLKCADTMVLYALGRSMTCDSDALVKYESMKSLMLLGHWEECVFVSAIHFLRVTENRVKLDLLQTMLICKNIHFANHDLASFQQFISILVEHAKFDLHKIDNEAQLRSELSLAASLVLAAFGVPHEAACARLLTAIRLPNDGRAWSREGFRADDGKKHVLLLKCCEALVRQLGCNQWLLVERVLHEVRWAPGWRQRCQAARLLVHLGPQYVCVKEHETRVFEYLESRLWEDTVEEVCLDVAKAIITLGMFQRACERAEKKLQHKDVQIRAEGVITIGALGVRNERIIRALLEILELDPSKYVKLLTIRSFASIRLSDKRIIRALREKEKSDVSLTKEATNTLNILISNKIEDIK